MRTDRAAGPAPDPVRTAATRRRRRGLALLSTGTAVGLATVASLAAWNDEEWVFGGGGSGTPGVGTSSFNVQQDTWSGPAAPTVATGSFADFEQNPGDDLEFVVDPSAMTPGDDIYAPVALTTEASSVAGTLTLQAPVPAVGQSADDPQGLLWENLTYSVRATTDATVAADCSAGSFATSGTVVAEDLTLADPLSASPQSLSAARGNVQYYCFRISLPDSAATQGLQGRSVYPAWRFAAVSE